MLERIIGFDAQFLFDAFIMGIAMLILFAALSYLLFNPVKKVLKDRKERIAGEIASAQKDKEEASLMKTEYEAKLREVDKEAGKILENARKKAQISENEILSEAREEANRIKDRASREIDLEKRKAMEEIKNELISLSALIAAKAVRASMNVDISASLVDDTLKEIGEGTWQS